MSDHTLIPASFGGADVAVADPRGRVANRDHIANSEWMEVALHPVGDHGWCVVGNGLSNQTFIKAPEGLIAVDTGECTEEMHAALDLVRTVTDEPVAAVIYSHFHYVFGTAALGDAEVLEAIDIWAHEDVEANLARSTSEIGPAYSRGICFQFGLFLPEEGPDGLVNVGLGKKFRNPNHAPYTPGHVPANHLVAAEGMTVASIAGLDVEFWPAPSDSDDSLTIWFPEIGVAINNLLWPALFNVFPIRGEEYRDPRVLLSGLDRLGALGAEFLVGAHGVPLAGAETIATEIERYRDSIQFLWDQTVRGINRGMTAGELIEFVQLPADYANHPRTKQFYGLAEHHVRQIHAGLRGWFDDDDARLFPLPTAERARRLIAGFGGAAAVRSQVQAAIDADELRWAAEMAAWLVQSDADPASGTVAAAAGSSEDRALLASVFRSIAQRTTAANIRAWCLTRANELDGILDLTRFRMHRLNYGTYANAPIETSVAVLRVLLDPSVAGGVEGSFAVRLDDGSQAGLIVRRSVAVPFDGADADATIVTTAKTWASVLARRSSLGDAIEAGEMTIEGDESRLGDLLKCFDIESLHG